MRGTDRSIGRAGALDVARVRGLYPALATGTAQLDGPLGALQPESVIRAIIATLRGGTSQPGSRSARSQQAATRLVRARSAAADLVGGRPEDVVLGSSPAHLVVRLAVLLSHGWQLGDQIVLNRFDPDLVVRPLLRLARERGVVVRWAEVELETGDLPAWQYDDLLTAHTRLVTVPLGNPATGVVPDVSGIAERAHRGGATVLLDVGAAVPHLPIDLTELGADLAVVDGATFGGPTVAAAVTRSGLLEGLRGVRPWLPAPDRFEAAPLPVELLDGFVAAVDHLADLADLAEPPGGTRRERLLAAVAAAAAHTGPLFARLDEQLRAIRGVTVLGGPERALPVAALTVAGRTPDEVGQFLQQRGVSVWTGGSGLVELMQTYGMDELGGAVFLGLMPHTTPAEVEHLVTAMRALARR